MAVKHRPISEVDSGTKGGRTGCGSAHLHQWM